MGLNFLTRFTKMMQLSQLPSCSLGLRLKAQVARFGCSLNIQTFLLTYDLVNVRVNLLNLKKFLVSGPFFGAKSGLGSSNYLF